VTCSIRTSGSTRISCTIVYRNAARSAAAKKVKPNAKATLVRNGRTYAKGRVASLKATRTVKRGRYTLRVGTLKLAVAVR
jgi:hypothetical protein